MYPDTIYCNLTLRSLGRPRSSSSLDVQVSNNNKKTVTGAKESGGNADNDELKTTIKGMEISKFKGRTYHQPTINCWLYALSSPRLTPPLSDDAYQ